MLTQDNFAEGTEVDFCNICKKAFTTEILKQWMATRRDKKCIHCAKPYNTTNFKRGKAHLVEQEGDIERVELIERQENTRNARIGFFGMLFG